MSNDTPFDDWIAYESADDEPEFTHNLGTVTVQDRVSFKDTDGRWFVTYRNPRSAKIADDGTLVHYTSNRCYVTYKSAIEFSSASNGPVSFSELL